MELEWLASPVKTDGGYPFEVRERIVDTRPLIRSVLEDIQKGTGAGIVARRFHSSVVGGIAAVCGGVRRDTSIEAVVLSGGVFMNLLLTCETVERLTGDGFRVYRHRLVPPNDGGLSLGQLAIAAARQRSL